MTTRQHPTRRDERTEVPKTQAELLDDVLSDISRHTSSLYRWLPLIRDLADTHREGLGFIPEATRKVLGRQHALDRLDRRIAISNGGAISAGESRAPGNMTSWGLEAEIALTLRHQVRFIVRRMHTDDCATRRAARADCTCDLLDRLEMPAPRREHETTEEVVHRFRAVAMQIPTLRIASAVLVDVAHLSETARQTLFGEDRTQLGAECPHCHRRTLVVYLQTGVIACERTRDDDGSIPPCKCGDRLCPCQVDHRFEHQWLRDRPAGHPRSWQTFAGVLMQHTNRKETTR